MIGEKEPLQNGSFVNFTRCGKDEIILKHLKSYWKKYRMESILAPLFKMLEATFDLIVPLVVAQIINIGIVNGDKNYIITRFAILTGMALMGLLCSFTAQFFAAKAATGTATGLRHQLLEHIQGLSFAELDTIGKSTLITRMTADINQVQNGMNMFLRLFLRSPFIVFGAMIMAFSINRKIALIFLALIPVLFIIVFGIMFLTKPIYKKQQQQLDEITTATRENLEGVRVVRAFGRENSEAESFYGINEAFAKTQLLAGKISAFLNPLTYVVINLGIVLILWFGAEKVDQGVLLSGDIIALVNYLSQILVELVKLANLIVLIGKAIVCMGRVGTVLDTENSMKFGTITRGNEKEQKVISFEKVGFTYPGASEQSLTDIDFQVERGQTIGIIGGTGSGKTSLVNLIARFYDATKGKVSFMGEPIKEWEEEALRKRIAVVMQKSRLFSGTIKTNLMFGKKDATEEEMWEALRLAQAEDFVKGKPEGLEAVVEQGGRNLSGGQKQRLNIARALIGKPDVLILDDSSSALDYGTDAALRKALKTLPETMTVIIISQRTSSIRYADRILVLEDGSLAGSGTHEELLEKCLVYREIHESTNKKEEA